MTFDFETSMNSWYLIPTILLLPSCIIWDDENGSWDKDKQSFVINISFLCFTFCISIDYRRKQK